MPKIPKIFIIPILVILLIGFRFVTEIGQDNAPESRFYVRRVIDGDTIELKGGDRMRLCGIDAPERGEPYYDSAHIFLENLTLGKTIEIDFANKRRDGYGRLLGYARLGTISINNEIIRNGLAHVYLFPDNSTNQPLINKLIKSQGDAISDKVGIWSIERSSEQYYLASQKSFRFHRPGCKSINNKKLDELIRFSLRLEAFESGYSPCRNCKP